MKKYGSLVAWIVLMLVISNLLGSIKGVDSSAWYDTLNRSSLTPPGWVFGVVWTILYVMIAIAGWMLFNKPTVGDFGNTKAIYIIQLLINYAWMPVFFYFRHLEFSFILVLILAVLVGFIVADLFRRRKAVAWVLLPYFVWSCFALYLNGVIVLNN